MNPFGWIPTCPGAADLSQPHLHPPLSSAGFSCVYACHLLCHPESSHRNNFDSGVILELIVGFHIEIVHLYIVSQTLSFFCCAACGISVPPLGTEPGPWY